MTTFHSKIIVIYLFLLSFFLVPAASFSQDEVKPKKEFKNTVRFNITNPLLFGGAIVVGYERTVGKYHSATLDVGTMSLPKFSLGIVPNSVGQYEITKGSTDKGIHVSGEFRFYLPHENKHEAPRGVYLAPFISYNFFERKNTWSLNTPSFQGDLATDMTLKMATIGGELGYQFILWKRVAIDLVLIGPGLTNYNFKVSLDTSLDPDDEAALFQKINDALASKIPGYSLVIDDAEFQKSGSINTTTAGFRYMIHLGFRF